MPYRLPFLLLMLVLSGSAMADDNKSDWRVSVEEREALISTAQVWQDPGDISQKDILTGPDAKFSVEEQVECRFNEEKYESFSGKTPKFWCQQTSKEGKTKGKNIKVKYGVKNGEVFGEVISTRLLWALGFYADRAYPVQILCENCPADPWLHMNRTRILSKAGLTDIPFDSSLHSQQSLKSRQIYRAHKYVDREDRARKGRTLEFPTAMIEKKNKSEKIYLDQATHAGWAFYELSLIDESKGGASKAQIDALKLLLAFIQHGDNKIDQQRLACPKKHVQEKNGQFQCDGPVRMFVQDLGSTFGNGATARFFTNEYSKADFASWSTSPLWANKERCQAFLPMAVGGTMRHPKVSEEGRAFLAKLLKQLTNSQIRDLFTLARFDQRQAVSSASIDQWVAAFIKKRQEILDHRCE